MIALILTTGESSFVFFFALFFRTAKNRETANPDLPVLGNVKLAAAKEGIDLQIYFRLGDFTLGQIYLAATEHSGDSPTFVIVDFKRSFYSTEGSKRIGGARARGYGIDIILSSFTKDKAKTKNKENYRPDIIHGV